HGFSGALRDGDGVSRQFVGWVERQRNPSKNLDASPRWVSLPLNPSYVFSPGGVRCASSAPASGGMRAKTKADKAEIAAMSRNAGGKSAAVTAPSPLLHTVSSTVAPPSATPAESDNCCPTAESAVARLMRC